MSADRPVSPGTALVARAAAALASVVVFSAALLGGVVIAFALMGDAGRARFEDGGGGAGPFVGLLFGAVVGGFGVRAVLAARRRWFRGPREPMPEPTARQFERAVRRGRS